MIKQHLEDHYNIGKLYNSYLISSDNIEMALAEVEGFVSTYLLEKTGESLRGNADYMIVQKESKTTKNIAVDQIRAMQKFLYKTSIVSGVKIAVIYAADQMNLNSANSCLKILEDTTANTHIFLLTENASALLPTIRSRCALINHHYDDGAKYSIDERFVKPLLKSTPLSERLAFIAEFSVKDRGLWIEFSSAAESLVAKFSMQFAGVASDLSSLEREVFAQFKSDSPEYLQMKYDQIGEIIKNTNNFDLDLRASCALLIDKFRS
ncbi:MAG: DNA polymerase III subunit delta' [Rickettsiales bacterium]|nr:MAG: DNA polymerase III subunit delta' [Rickettsiales bacterium]